VGGGGTGGASGRPCWPMIAPPTEQPEGRSSMTRRIEAVIILVVAAGLLAACTTAPQQASMQERERQVADTERAFAKTMADRDFAAFTTFLSPEAVFLSGSGARRGKQAVSDTWQRFYQGPDAPFSWTPDRVEVLDSGNLALSTGPVYDRSGKLIARFSS